MYAVFLFKIRRLYVKDGSLQGYQRLRDKLYHFFQSVVLRGVRFDLD